MYLSIDPARTPMTPGELSRSIHVNSELGGSGYIQVGADGTEKQISLPSA